jgi:hypothetical protein
VRETLAFPRLARKLLRYERDWLEVLMNARTTRILYWTFTALFIVPQAWSALQMITEAPRMTETLHSLGYPLYFMKLLGVAKLLGAAAILLSPYRTLKEWAYAGFMFDVIGAFVSHVAHRDPMLTASVPLIFLGAQVCSYLAWRRLLQLGASPTTIGSLAPQHSGGWAARRA